MLNKQENMSTGSLRLFERKKTKATKVLELFNQGYSYWKIAKLVHLSLRDVSKFINLAADKYRTPSTTSIHDLILEYRVSNYRHELRDLRLEKDINNLELLTNPSHVWNRISEALSIDNNIKWTRYLFRYY